MPDTVVTLKIRGRVQGVGYRQWMVEAARARGLRGWVRNRSGGWVEALVAGPEEQVDALVAACRGGPSMAKVQSIDVEVPETGAASISNLSRSFVALGSR